MAIQSFADKQTELVWQQRFSKRLPPEVQKHGLRKLVMLARAKDLNDLKVPKGNALEQLSGDRAGQYSIRINDQWRVCFRWSDGNASEVEITDYH